MKKGFTLIELLIVVAIIAILAAIAVPNFLEAQTRAKIAHELSNMRTDKTGLESYRVDNNEYPPDTNNEDYSWHFLTTPIAYLSTIPEAIFKEKRTSGGVDTEFPWFQYYGGGITTSAKDVAAGSVLRKSAYAASSAGPDQDRDFGTGGAALWSIGPSPGYQVTFGETSKFRDSLYDPTNGTVSGGDFVSSNLGVFHGN